MAEAVEHLATVVPLRSTFTCKIGIRASGAPRARDPDGLDLFARLPMTMALLFVALDDHLDAVRRPSHSVTGG